MSDDSLPATTRPIDKKRINSLLERQEQKNQEREIWFTHSIFTQCFLPYRDPKETHWIKRNGKYSIMLSAGPIDHPSMQRPGKVLGLPFGSKPRLFQSHYCTLAIQNQSPVIPVERSMTAMMKKLKMGTTGGKEGPIKPFKEQIMRYAACHFRIAGPKLRGETEVHTHINAEPFKVFDVWFPEDPRQETLWPTEIILNTDFYESLKEHAVPFDIEATIPIKNNARALDVYLWLTQRLCRIPHDKPLYLNWVTLFEQFSGGQAELRSFKKPFEQALLAARSCYPDAVMEEHPGKEGWIFKHSKPPIPKTALVIPFKDKSGDE
jgi:hypothetical protein